MAAESPIRLADGFQEAFRNKYVTDFSSKVILGSLLQLLIGVIGVFMMLWLIVYLGLVVLYFTIGFDPLGFHEDSSMNDVSIRSWIESLFVFLVWMGFFAYLGPGNFILLKRRLLDRLYVFGGRPLAFVEGPPAFSPDSETGFQGVEVDSFYFDFDNCLLEVNDQDLEGLQKKEGILRIWYIPKQIRSWHHPLLNRRINYNATLVRAEWRA